MHMLVQMFFIVWKKKKKTKLTLKNEDVLTIISIILRVRDTYTKKEKWKETIIGGVRKAPFHLNSVVVSRYCGSLQSPAQATAKANIHI